MNKIGLFTGIGVTAIIVLILGVSMFNWFNPNPINNLDNLDVAHDFTVPSVDGADYTLGDDTGKVIAFNMVYTRCMMGCSVQMANLAGVRNKLVANGQMDNVKFVTMSFDTIMDSLSTMEGYANTYGNGTDTSQWQFLMPQSEDLLNAIADAYDFTYTLTGDNMTMNGMDMGPEYNHDFIVFLIDQNGNIRHKTIGKSFETDDLYWPIDFLLNE